MSSVRRIFDDKDFKYVKETKIKPCNHPEHNPPSLISLPPGTYEHICPGCGYKTVFVVPDRVSL